MVKGSKNSKNESKNKNKNQNKTTIKSHISNNERKKNFFKEYTFKLPENVLFNIFQYIPINILRSKYLSPAYVCKTWADNVFRITWRNIHILWAKPLCEYSYDMRENVESAQNERDWEELLQPGQHTLPRSEYGYQHFSCYKKVFQQQKVIFDYKRYIRRAILITQHENPSLVFGYLKSIPNLSIDSYSCLLFDPHMSYLTQFLNMGLMTSTLIITETVIPCPTLPTRQYDGEYPKESEIPFCLRYLFFFRSYISYIKDDDDEDDEDDDEDDERDIGWYTLLCRKRDIETFNLNSGKTNRSVSWEYGISALALKKLYLCLADCFLSPQFTSFHLSTDYNEDTVKYIFKNGHYLTDLVLADVVLGELDFDFEDPYHNNISVIPHGRIKFELGNLERLYMIDTELEPGFIRIISESCPKLKEFTYVYEQFDDDDDDFYEPDMDEFEHLSTNCLDLERFEWVIRQEDSYDRLDYIKLHWLQVFGGLLKGCRKLKTLITAVDYHDFANDKFSDVYAQLIDLNPELQHFVFATNSERRLRFDPSPEKYKSKWFLKWFTIPLHTPGNRDDRIVQVDVVRYIVDHHIKTSPRTSIHDYRLFSYDGISTEMIKSARLAVRSLPLKAKYPLVRHEDLFEFFADDDSIEIEETCTDDEEEEEDDDDLESFFEYIPSDDDNNIMDNYYEF